MNLSIFTDELGFDLTEGLPIIKSWGLDCVDLRGRVFGNHFEKLDPGELPKLKQLLDDHGMKVTCLQSSLAKVHLPDEERQQSEAEKLESIIRAADTLDCRLVRSFHFWQPKGDEAGSLAEDSEALQKVLDQYGPLAERARQAGLILGFENCGVTPDEVFTVLDALDVDGWGLAWDPCNCWGYPEWKKDEDAFFQRMLGRTIMLHVKARRAVSGPAEEQIPYDKILRLYWEAGIEGPVSAETHNPDKSVSNDQMSRRLVDYLKEAWPSVMATS